MNRIILLLIIISLFIFGKQLIRTHSAGPASAAKSSAIEDTRRTPSTTRPDNPSFRCDGRIHCSQMTSCEEATWFLNNCPGTRMDGDGDGVPCEDQWCR